MASAATSPNPNSIARDLTGRRLGRYEVLTQLASGGMATVYIARAQGVAGFERLVAVKVLHPHLAHDEDFISMFLDEARLAARIRHPNAVATLDISDTQGDGYFLVMEYVEGDHFGALLRAAARGGERLPVQVVARVVLDALSGLSAAHRLVGGDGEPLHLVHRDISPHNILVAIDGIARITDFGVAKAQVRLSSTRDGQFKGKLSYMAPEQAAAGVADQRSDLFSMGIVLWESLTGRRLFRGENNADVLNKILNPDVPPPSSYDPALVPFDEVTAKALAREPDERFQTADEFIEALDAAAHSVGGVANTRVVGGVVNRWLAEKLEAERVAVRDAIEALGRSDLGPGVLPRPMESGSQPSMPGGHSLVRPIADEVTVGAKPSTVMDLPMVERRRPLPVWALALGLLLVGGLGAGLAWAFIGAPEVPQPAAAPNAAPAEPGLAAEAAQAAAAAAEEATSAAAEAEPALPVADGSETAEAEAEAEAEREAAAAAEESESAREARAQRRIRALRRGRRGGESTPTETAREAQPPPPSETRPSERRPRRDDDLVINPYRR